ncbi:hypothetical protein N7492_010159 [Penicillium capsulatum]|uniref:R3H domain protein n=1 Tax=Penicillium capsulatum TaxID=69766 RepID=A0A9W9HMW6_9EURO|nr:hypothetical protein N7492_010159 [Penicillium capsulatum]KAJ6112667.1 hypothetical protein N7512_007991 [Penicillium capsulatum]
MASRSSSQGEGHISFAKIAAMAAPSHPQSPSASGESFDAPPAQTSTYAERFNTDVPLSNPHLRTSKQQPALSGHDVDELGRAVQNMDLSLQKDHEGSGSSIDGQDNGLLKRENSFEDDRTHLSNSSTKMTNFDSKSLASVTTFAMDEKDSVRPDDSASVQAIDEEESLSGPASGAPNSVTGSEAGGRAFRDGNPLRHRGILPAPGPNYNGANQRGPVAIPPDSVSNNFVVPANPANLQDGQSLHGFPLEPDEKLIEAMKCPKDRLLILQLEDKIRHFIKNSSEQSLELPPSNAFGRLLAHKLGDYYHLTHFVDNNVTSVRLHRTPFCRMSTPLSAVHAATSTTPPPSVPAMKIMRRTDGERPSTDGSTAPSSSVPSKNPSEAGDSGAEGALSTKDRLVLTREEREAKYHEARERIFRDFPESAKSDSVPGDSSANLSRSSSTNGRKKNQQRQRTPHDDSFEVRSQFNAYYPGVPYNNGPGQFNTGMNEGSLSSQVPYLVGPGVPPPTGGYMSPNQNGPMYPGPMGMNNMPQYPMVGPSAPPASHGTWQGGNMPQQSPYPGYSSSNQPGAMGSQLSAKSSPSMNNYAIPQSPQYPQNSGWNPQPYAGTFPQPSPQRNQPPAHWPKYPSQSVNPNMAMHPYAQYPGQHLHQGFQNIAGAQAPAGGLSRSHFNPQTRSFVPGDAPAPHHPSKVIQHPMQPYGAMAPSVPGQWNGYPDPSFMATGNMLRGPPNNSRDSIAKWGTPSHLPPKPPPSEVPSEFDLKHRTGPGGIAPPTPISPAGYPNNGAVPGPKNGPFVVSGGNGASPTN